MQYKSIDPMTQRLAGIALSNTFQILPVSSAVLFLQFVESPLQFVEVRESIHDRPWRPKPSGVHSRYIATIPANIRAAAMFEVISKRYR